MAQHRLPDQRSHHISSIAHHFFDMPDDRAAGIEPSIGEIVVGSAGPGPLAAWICAGLAGNLGPKEVVLAESPFLMWSAASYLEEARLDPLEKNDAIVSRNGNSLRFWRVVQGSERVLLRNFGHLTSRQLSDLEAALPAGNPTGISIPGGGALVWCLTTEEAHSVAAAFSLGRVLALFQPACLEIVVCNLMLKKPGLAAAGSAHLSMNRCRQLVAAVAKGVPVAFTEIPHGTSEISSGPSELFQSIGRRVLYSD